MTEVKIDDLTEKQAKDLLRKLVEKLNDLDSDDFFGTEGWKKFLGLK